jgi:hypothetical protein
MGLIGLWDIVIVIFAVLSLTTLIFLLKKEKVLALLLSIYLAFVFVEEFLIFNFSFLQLKIFTFNAFLPEILFAIAIIVFFFLFIKSGFYKSYAKSHYRKSGKIYFLNILAIGLFIALSIHYFLPPYIKQNLSLPLSFMFNSIIGFFLWIAIPIFSIFLVKKGR